jgi:hypothetical protein
MVVDDNSKVYGDYENVKIIQIPDEESKINGFIYSSSETIPKSVVSWDKALYYFSKVCPDTFKFIWFLEDDVFLYNEQMLSNIDKKYGNPDLLSPKLREGNEWSHWKTIQIHHNPPYLSSMVCSVRMSSSLLKAIESYATTNKELYFIEAMFPTECRFAGLIQQSIPELYNIFWEKETKFKIYLKENLYHPIKNISDHYKIRKSLDSI